MGRYDDNVARVELMRSVPLHSLLELTVADVGKGRAVITMPVRGNALNGSGNLHGGALATLLDVATGMAAGSATGIDREQQTLVTADIHVRFLGRPKTPMVEGVGEVVRMGRQLVVVDGRVVDTDGNVIASADASFMVVELRRPLPAADNVDPRNLDL